MTLVLAIACSDGIIMAAESASTDSETGVKQPVNKIRKIAEQPILYGGSGDVGLIQKIDENLHSFTLGPTVKRIRQEIKQKVLPELDEARKLHVPYPYPGFNHPPPAILLFGFIHGNRPWILEIERDGRDTIYDDDMGAFCAIGSGKPWAQAGFRLHLSTERNLQTGKLLAHRVIEDAIEIAAANLARPIHIYALSLDGTISKVDEEEAKQLQIKCELWRSLERETLGQLAPAVSGPIPSASVGIPGEEAEVPTPDQG